MCTVDLSATLLASDDASVWALGWETPLICTFWVCGSRGEREFLSLGRGCWVSWGQGCWVKTPLRLMMMYSRSIVPHKLSLSLLEFVRARARCLSRRQLICLSAHSKTLQPSKTVEPIACPPRRLSYWSASALGPIMSDNDGTNIQRKSYVK